MRKLLVIAAAAGAIAWSGVAFAFVDESSVNITNKGEELNGSTVSLTPLEEKTEKVHRSSKKSSSRTSRKARHADHEESQAERRRNVERTLEMIDVGISIGTGLHHGGGGGGSDRGHHGEHHKD